MNAFLASLEITFRRDPTNYRPRVNKKHSIKDREQKGKLLISSYMLACLAKYTLSTITDSGNYFFLED
jgi:hypothetical protein